MIWQHLGAHGSIWKHLEAAGSNWQHLGWQHLAPSGTIWHQLAPSGSIWHHLASPAERSEPWSPELRTKHSFLWKRQQKYVSGDKSDDYKWEVLTFAQIGETVRDHSWEVVTFAKPNGHFTKYFEGQVQQVLYFRRDGTMTSAHGGPPRAQ